MDVARYADSHGYLDDGLRTMWPWRDWVIEKFNENMPYDKFVTWQLAGDLMPDATKEQIMATGFNRNHPQNGEGGIVPEEYRVEYVADRAQTFGKAFLGLTVECARCHDHKYDPISQKEYFQLFAFFNNVDETGLAPEVSEPSPTILAYEKGTEAIVKGIEDEKLDIDHQLENQFSFQNNNFKDWLNQSAAKKLKGFNLTKDLIARFPFNGNTMNVALQNTVNRKFNAYIDGFYKENIQLEKGKTKNGIRFLGDASIDIKSPLAFFDRHEPFTFALWLKLDNEKAEGPIFSREGRPNTGYRGYELILKEDGRLEASLHHTAPSNSITVISKNPVQYNAWMHIAMSWDGKSEAEGLKLFIDGKAIPVSIENDNLFGSLLTKRVKKQKSNKKKNSNKSPNAKIAAKQKPQSVELTGPGLVFGKARYIGGGGFESLNHATIDEVYVYSRNLSALEIASLYTKDSQAENTLESLIKKKPAELSNTERQLLLEFYLNNFDSDWRNTYKDYLSVIAKETEFNSSQTQVMVMGDLKEPRKTFILDRGAYDAPTDQVYPGTIKTIMSFPEGLPKNRLGLSTWLTDDKNPIFARVTVNRYWQMVFGKGLVSTTADFGNQGQLPSHPKLLDWLAINFIKNNWDVKWLLKTMVMSATYRQSSHSTEALLEMDPDNRLLARAPAYRMSAETIRDNVLAASGLLVRNIGGEPVKPYQPPGLWSELARGVNSPRYVEDSGDNLYRRSMYTIWKRAAPPPSMISFDASTRFFCEVKRQKTSTPLQSLVLLNDPQLIEAARVIAERMLKEGGTTLKDQINYGFKLLTSRNADDVELNILSQLYNDEYAIFQQNQTDAEKLVSVGESNRDKTLPLTEHAALTMVARTIINFDESIFIR